MYRSACRLKCMSKFYELAKVNGSKKIATTMTSWRVFLDPLGTLLFIKLLKKCTMQIELSHAAFLKKYISPCCVMAKTMTR